MKTLPDTLPPGPYLISAFYRFNFIPKPEVESVRLEVEKFGIDRNMMGLVLIGTEGINGTVAGTPSAVLEFQDFLNAHVYFAPVEFKNSRSETKSPFRRWKVRERVEIVTLGDPSIVPLDTHHRHLSPTDWDRAMKEDDVVVLDTRNLYEAELGKFRDAITPAIQDFQEFPEWLDKNPVPKDKKVLIYCTGGIRCEKAIYAMESRGYDNVFQLQGGILNYLEQFPEQEFEGECFVFDRRVAVDQKLNPTTRFDLCTHCGQPSKDFVVCDRCERQGPTCVKCQNSVPFRSCSKNCTNALMKDPSKKGRPQVIAWSPPPKAKI